MRKLKMKTTLIFCVLLLLLIFSQYSSFQISALSRENILSEYEVIDSGDISDNIVWELFSDGTLVISGEGEIRYYDYMTGDHSPFYNNDDIKNIVVKSGIESISSSLFYECNSVKSVFIEEGVKEIGDEILFDCDTVVNVTLPSTLLSIGRDNHSLTTAPSVFFAGSEEQWNKINGAKIYDNKNIHYNTLFYNEIAYQVEDGQAKLVGVDVALCQEELVLPETINGYPLTEIDTHSFELVDNVKHLVVPKSVTNLGEGAFYHFISLESIDLPDSITYLPASAFERCDKLTEVVLPDSITEFKSKLKKYNGIEYEGGTGSTFAYCSSLQSVKLPENLTALPAYTFEYCTSLKEITIPDSVTQFLVTFNIKSINLETLEIKYSYFGSGIFSNCASLEKVVLSENLESLADNSFRSCVSLKSIYIPESVKIVESEAFKNCTALESIVFGTETAPKRRMLLASGGASSSETEKLSIASAAFESCTALKYVSIDRAVSKIEEKAFYDCNKISDVYYSGNEQEWQNIEIGARNENLLGARIHYNSQPDFIHNMQETITKDPTCEEAGTADYVCDCGATFTGKITALKHDYSDTYTIDRKATCTSEGSMSKHCTREGCTAKTSVTAIAKLAHTEVTEKGKAATCTATGLTDGKKCSVCGTVTVAQKTVAKKAHTYKTVTTKATLKKNGKQVTKCTVCGEVKTSKTIYYPKSIKLSATSYTYNGKTKKPSVTVKDSKGKTLKKDTDYTVKYSSGRKNPGKYTVTVTFKGKYSGTKKLSFTIKPKAVTLSKVTAGSKQLTANWKTVAAVTGYEVQASTSSKFTSKTTKKVTVKSAKTKKTTIKKLKKGKKYYIKVRAYKTVDGKKIYGAWSAVKSIKVK